MYPGQLAFCTSTGSGYTIDNIYVRNAANSAWVNLVDVTSSITPSSEYSTTPVTDDNDFTVTSGHRYYMMFTLPTTETLYYITGIEWKNGASVSDVIISGIDQINSLTPTITTTPLIALAQELTQSGTNAVQRSSVVSSKLIPAGTILGAWVSCNAATILRKDNGAGGAYSKATSYTSAPASASGTAWTSGVDPLYIKVYFKGYQ